jgi:hypothetical protein
LATPFETAIDDWQHHEVESAMLHACNAVDGTSRKIYPRLGSNARFTGLLRNNYCILGPMGAPGINLMETRFPIRVERPKASGGKPDLADVIYGIHRCTHGHGDELPDGFELLPDAAGPARITHMEIEKGKIRLSDRVIFALLGVAVFLPANTNQRVPDCYYLMFASTKLSINDWWGRRADFLAITAGERLPCVKLDFGEWQGQF